MVSTMSVALFLESLTYRSARCRVHSSSNTSEESGNAAIAFVAEVQPYSGYS